MFIFIKCVHYTISPFLITIINWYLEGLICNISSNKILICKDAVVVGPDITGSEAGNCFVMCSNLHICSSKYTTDVVHGYSHPGVVHHPAVRLSNVSSL